MTTSAMCNFVNIVGKDRPIIIHWTSIFKEGHELSTQLIHAGIQVNLPYVFEDTIS